MDLLVWLFPLCLGLRLTPLILRPRAKAYDTLFHLSLARCIREDGKVPLTLPGVVPEYPLAYPYLFHRLLALFPLGWHPKVERLLPAIFDTLLLACVLFLASFTTGGATPALPLYAGLLFIFHPALLRYDSGPRLHYGSPRVMGQLVYNVHIISLYYAWQTDSLTALAISLVAGAAVFLVSKFCIQATLFFSVLVVALVSPWYLLVLAGSFALGCLCTRGRLLRDMRYHVCYAILYARQLQQRYLYPYHSPYVSYVKKLWGCLRNVRRNPRALLMHIYWVQRNPLNNIVFLYPESLVLTGALLLGALPPWHPLYVFPLAGCLCMFLIETKPFMFLGEGERYMQYAAPTLCVLAAQVMLQLPPVFTALYCLYGLLFWAVGMAAFWLLTKEGAFNETLLKQFFSQVNILPTGNILCLGSFGWHCLYFCSHPFYQPLNPGPDAHHPRWRPLYANYPFPSGDFEELLLKFPVSYIVTDGIHLERYKKIMTDPLCFEHRCRLLHQVGGMCLYEVLPPSPPLLPEVLP